VSVPNVELLSQHWNQTQFGKLMQDPVMQPFVEDLKQQVQNKLSQTSIRLGVSWDDLKGVASGELAIALLQPWDRSIEQPRIEAAGEEAAAKAKAAGKKPDAIAAARAAAVTKAREDLDAQRRQQAAVVLLVDVTGRLEAAQELLGKITQNQLEKGATRSELELHGTRVSVFTFPKKEGQTTQRQAFYGIHQDQLIATDRQDVLSSLLVRFDQPGTGLLQEFPPFVATMNSTRTAMGQTQAHIRWFLEPFGYTEVSRAYNGGRKRRGTDMLRVLSNQGFTAIQGLGGQIALKTDRHDIRHHTLIYAPAVAREPGDASSTKYNLAARMLDFPNTEHLTPQPWIPRDLATHLTFNWKMKEAFWNAETLVNEMAGDDVFQDVMANIELDPHGPQIKVKEEFTDHLAERATLISDYRLPITTKSERILVAIQVNSPDSVMQTVNRAMENDPAAKKREHNGHVIWELVNEETPVTEVQIDGFDNGFGFDDPMEQKMNEEEKPFIPNSAVTVAHGHLLMASHVDYIVDVLDAPSAEDTLAAAVDYQAVQEALTGLGAGDDSFRLFTRTDEAYRTTYELLQQGKMPESESLLGKLLNRIFASDEDEETLREQQIDGSRMPDYQAVRRYLGPTGFYVRTVDEGWVVSGCLLTKEL